VLAAYRRVPLVLRWQMSGPGWVVEHGVCHRIWWCMAPMLAFLGVLRWVMRLQPSGPRVPSVQGYLDCTCQALSTLRPHP
jgi:hypothetical protein